MLESYYRGAVGKEKKGKMWGGGYLGNSSVGRDRLGIGIDDSYKSTGKEIKDFVSHE